MTFLVASFREIDSTSFLIGPRAELRRELAARAEEAVLLDAPAARSVVRRWADSLDDRRLRDAVEGWHAFASTAGEERRRALLERLLDQVGWSVLVARMPTRAIARVPGPRVEERERAPELRTWIELELIDSSGFPVAATEYEIRAADGRVIRGVTSEAGIARIENLVPGSCQISFPTLDGAAWDATGRS